MTNLEAFIVALRYNFQLWNFRQHLIEFGRDMDAGIAAIWAGVFALVCIPIAFIWILLLPVRMFCFAVFTSFIATEHELREMKESMWRKN